jgi:hypothetical protein
MRILFTNSTLNIKSGMTVSGVSNQRESLSVVRGRVWVTVEGSPDDYWLGAGDTFVVEPGKLVVVEAYRGDSQILLSSEQDEPRDGQPLEAEPRRAFDFFRAGESTSTPASAKAGDGQFGYTGDLCQQQQQPAQQQAEPATA